MFVPKSTFSPLAIFPRLFPLSEAHEPLSFTCGISTGSTKMTSLCLGPGLGATLGVCSCPWVICILIRRVRAGTLPGLSELALLVCSPLSWQNGLQCVIAPRVQRGIR